MKRSRFTEGQISAGDIGEFHVWHAPILRRRVDQHFVARSGADTLGCHRRLINVEVKDASAEWPKCLDVSMVEIWPGQDGRDRGFS